MANWGSTLKQYLVLVPRVACRMFLLLPSCMTEPLWLRDFFSKVRDPNKHDVHMCCKWGLNLTGSLVYL